LRITGKFQVIMGTNRAFFGEDAEIQGAGNALSGTLYTDR